MGSEEKYLSTRFRIRNTYNINTHTKKFYFSVSFNPHSDHPVEFFPTGRGKVGQKLETELNGLDVQSVETYTGESEDDLPRMPSRNGASTRPKPNVGKRL